jgi:hypothetical protein
MLYYVLVIYLYVGVSFLLNFSFKNCIQVAEPVFRFVNFGTVSVQIIDKFCSYGIYFLRRTKDFEN